VYLFEKQQYTLEAILMHRVIMKPPLGMDIDHKDHNGLNNQKFNLRICTRKQNARNKRSTGSSIYLGVYKTKRNYICARISMDGCCKHIGNFKTEEAAARAYDEVAKRCHGEFANLNFK
jgi:hypothetical protein